LSDRLKKWSDIDKAVLGISSFCVIALLYLILNGIMVPDNTFLSLNTNNIQIDSKQEYLIVGGVTEPGSKVYIDNRDINLNRLPVKVQKNGSFEYKIKIPPQITDISVSVVSKAKGKYEVGQDILIQRPLTFLFLNPMQKISYRENKITVKGKTEPGASIIIISKMNFRDNLDPQSYVQTALDDTVIKKVSLKADFEGNFKHIFIFPPNSTSAYVNVTAIKSGQRSTTQIQNLSREFAIFPPIISIFEGGNLKNDFYMKFYNGPVFTINYPPNWDKRSHKEAGKDSRLFLKYKNNLECTVWHYKVGGNFGSSIQEYERKQDIYMQKWWGGTQIYEQKVSINGARGIRTIYKCRQNPLFSSNIPVPFYLDRTTLTKDNVNVFELQIMASANYYEKNGYLIQKTVEGFILK